MFELIPLVSVLRQFQRRKEASKGSDVPTAHGPRSVSSDHV